MQTIFAVFYRQRIDVWFNQACVLFWLRELGRALSVLQAIHSKSSQNNNVLLPWQTQLLHQLKWLLNQQEQAVDTIKMAKFKPCCLRDVHWAKYSIIQNRGCPVLAFDGSTVTLNGLLSHRLLKTSTSSTIRARKLALVMAAKAILGHFMHYSLFPYAQLFDFLEGNEGNGIDLLDNDTIPWACALIRMLQDGNLSIEGFLKDNNNSTTKILECVDCNVRWSSVLWQTILSFSELNRVWDLRRQFDVREVKIVSCWDTAQRYPYSYNIEKHGLPCGSTARYAVKFTSNPIAEWLLLSNDPAQLNLSISLEWTVGNKTFTNPLSLSKTELGTIDTYFDLSTIDEGTLLLKGILIQSSNFSGFFALNCKASLHFKRDANLLTSETFLPDRFYARQVIRSTTQNNHVILYRHQPSIKTIDIKIKNTVYKVMVEMCPVIVVSVDLLKIIVYLHTGHFIKSLLLCELYEGRRLLSSNSLHRKPLKQANTPNDSNEFSNDCVWLEGGKTKAMEMQPAGLTSLSDKNSKLIDIRLIITLGDTEEPMEFSIPFWHTRRR